MKLCIVGLPLIIGHLCRHIVQDWLLLITTSHVVWSLLSFPLEGSERWLSVIYWRHFDVVHESVVVVVICGKVLI